MPESSPLALLHQQLYCNHRIRSSFLTGFRRVQGPTAAGPGAGPLPVTRHRCLRLDRRAPTLRIAIRLRKTTINSYVKTTGIRGHLGLKRTEIARSASMAPRIWRSEDVRRQRVKCTNGALNFRKILKSKKTSSPISFS